MTKSEHLRISLVGELGEGPYICICRPENVEQARAWMACVGLEAKIHESLYPERNRAHIVSREWMQERRPSYLKTRPAESGDER